MRELSPFSIMNIIFGGLALSLSLGVLGALLLYFLEGNLIYAQFLNAYSISFRTVLSLGLILGTAILVFRSQGLIPRIIDSAFTEEQLSMTDYYFYRQRFWSRQRSLLFAGEFVLIGYAVFTQCQFPFSGLSQTLMMIAACAEYALGVYVGRKLCYAGLMLHSLTEIRVERNLFQNHELDPINSYVNIISTLTIIFVYVHVSSYIDAPFVYGQAMGESARIFLIIPAIIATPVLAIFNFYPRLVLRKVYRESIDNAIQSLRETLKNEDLTNFERMSYVIEFKKMEKDELRYRLRLTLSDLPIGITILIMVLGPLLGN